MEFERARTKEQKDLRIAEILEAAMKQYHDIPYDKISLASISKDLSFSRVNLYKYFKTKEEIFMKIIELDMYKYIDKLKLVFLGQPSRDVKHFADKYAAVLFSERRMIALMSRLLSELESNTTVEKLAEYKKVHFSMYDEVCIILQKQLPMLNDEQVKKLLSAINIYAIGLIPSSLVSKKRQKALEMIGAENRIIDFTGTFSDFIVTYVKGIMAG